MKLLHLNSFRAIALTLFLGASGAAQEQPAPNEPQVQARGPVHEAFARPGDISATTPVNAKEPPPPIKELPPLQRPDMENVQWIGGYWAFDDEAKDYVWISGTWRVPPPGRQWLPGQWNKVANGWQWQHGVWAPNDPGAVKPFESMPPNSLEVGPSTPAPNDDSFYTPGQWVFQSGEWIWQPGSWAPNRGNMAYVPPAYLPAQNGGSLYVPGYWDYPLEDRGLLFAPVTFGGTPWIGNPGWFYRPSYTVGISGLLGSLFLRPNWGSYYYGNYYGSNYRSLGYSPWVATGRRGYEPLWNYYTWANRHTPGWNTNLAGLYNGRQNGTLPLPASTYAQQVRTHHNLNTTIVNNNTIAFGRNVSVNPINSLQTVHSFAQPSHVRLTNATPVDQTGRAISVKHDHMAHPNLTLPTPPSASVRPATTFSNPSIHVPSSGGIGIARAQMPAHTTTVHRAPAMPAQLPRFQPAPAHGMPAHHAAPAHRSVPAHSAGHRR